MERTSGPCAQVGELMTSWWGAEEVKWGARGEHVFSATTDDVFHYLMMPEMRRQQKLSARPSRGRP